MERKDLSEISIIYNIRNKDVNIFGAEFEKIMKIYAK